MRTPRLIRVERMSQPSRQGEVRVLKQVELSCAEAGVLRPYMGVTVPGGLHDAGPSRQISGGKSRRMPYHVQWETDRVDDPCFLREWQELLDASEGPEPIYQSPEFLQYVRQTSQDPEEVEVLTVRSADDGRLVALTPIRKRELALGLQVKHHRLNLGTLNVGTIMGSAFLGDESPAVLSSLLHFLFQDRPGLAAVSLPALGRQGGTWRSLKTVTAEHRDLRACVLSDWRDCHRIPLPGDFNAYLAQFGSKHRYNLKRQIRLLREHAPMEMVRVDRPDQMDLLQAAIDRLAPPEVKAVLISSEKFQTMARLGLLRCYVLSSGGVPVAALVATQFGHILHLHNVLSDPSMLRFSVGTSLLYLAIEDLSSEGRFSAIDLGYSSPSHSHQSSNRVETRGHLLVFKSNLRTWALCMAERVFGQCVEQAKRWQQAFNGWKARRAAAAKAQAKASTQESSAAAAPAPGKAGPEA